jgi:hypothetical protein
MVDWPCSAEALDQATMKRSTLPGGLLLLGLTAFALGCGGSTDAGSGPPHLGAALLASTCSNLAEQYKAVLETDASLCTPGDPATCSARRPIWGVVMAGDAVASYGLSECPVAGSGAPVNPGRTGRLDELLAAYRAKGCDLSAAPGCGAPGWTPPIATCPAVGAAAAHCQ